MIRIAACSYEGSLFGWKMGSPKDLEDQSKETDSQQIELQFGLHIAHGSFKSIAISKSGKYLAVGGMTERIYLYSMNDNKEIGEIFGHNGAITSLSFFEDAFIISGSEDHTLNLWRVHDRQLLHILGGHKDTVNSFAIHPTGKIALSVSKDHTMRLWNLVQGRCSYTRRLRTTADLVLWNPLGTSYMIVTPKEIQLFDINDNNSVKVNISTKSRVNYAIFVRLVVNGDDKSAPKEVKEADNGDENVRIAYICDDNTLTLCDMTGKVTATLNMKSTGAGRLRSMSTVIIPPIQGNTSTNEGIVLVTSNGCMFILRSNVLENEDSDAISTEADTGEQLSKDELLFSKALYGFHQLKADPRLTAVTAWRVSSSNDQAIVTNSGVLEEIEDNNNMSNNNSSSSNSSKQKSSKKDKKRSYNEDEKKVKGAQGEEDDRQPPKKQKKVAFEAKKYRK
jgi:WD40 repeat protein